MDFHGFQLTQDKIPHILVYEQFNFTKKQKKQKEMIKTHQTKNSFHKQSSSSFKKQNIEFKQL